MLRLLLCVYQAGGEGGLLGLFLAVRALEPKGRKAELVKPTWVEGADKSLCQHRRVRDSSFTGAAKATLKPDMDSVWSCPVQTSRSNSSQRTGPGTHPELLFENGENQTEKKSHFMSIT